MHRCPTSCPRRLTDLPARAASLESLNTLVLDYNGFKAVPEVCVCVACDVKTSMPASVWARRPCASCAHLWCSGEAGVGERQAQQ